MQTHVFVARSEFAQDQDDDFRAMACNVLRKVADGTDTSGLVVAVYFLENSDVWRGELTSRKPVKQDAFTASRRRWAFTKGFAIPSDLPESFALVRVALGSHWRRKTTLTDRSGHLLKFGRFEDHLAFIFAHELHHFRRYHLGQHAGEGEKSADRWAIERVAALGYKAEIVGTEERRAPAKVVKTRVPMEPNALLVQRIKARAANLCLEDLRKLAGWTGARIAEFEEAAERSAWEKHYHLLRDLPQGAKLKVTRGRHRGVDQVGQVMTKERTLGRGSKRIAVRDQRKKLWYWPMRWLEPIGQPPAPVQPQRP